MLLANILLSNKSITSNLNLKFAPTKISEWQLCILSDV